MLKALIKKQLMELNAFYFQDRKTGKRRTKGGIIGYGVLYALIFVGLGFAFYELASMMGVAMIPAGLGWMYYSFMGMLAVFLGVFGSVFNTYSSLYLSKDNELLISMPIPASYILLSRMLGVFSMALLYLSLVYIPTVIVYLIIGGFSVGALLSGIVMLLLSTLFATVLCCILGWVVAVISTKLKNKSFITVLISLVFFAAYYMFCGNYYMLIQKLLLNMDSVGTAIRGKAYPLYVFGAAAAGEPLPLLIFAVFVIAAIALTAYVLSRSFTKITTMKRGEKKAVYTEKAVKVSGVGKALFQREFKRYTSSATYMLNCSLGTVIMPVMAIGALIMLNDIRDIMSIFSENAGFLSVLVLVIVCTACAMNDITAPSVSLEGKNIWIVRSMPVPISKVLEAKMHLHWALTMPPVILLAIAMGIVIEADIVDILLMIFFAVSCVMFNASLGLVLNLKMPNLSWTNEAAPIKQSLPVMICLFGGWLIAAVIGISGYFLSRMLSGTEIIVVWMVVFALGARFLNRWLYTRGVRIFSEL